jgi:oligoendopeptidase F
MPVASAIPRWDLSPFFPGVETPEFNAASSALEADVATAEGLWDRLGVTAGGAGDAAAIEQVLGKLNKLYDDARLLSCYLECLTTTDSTDEASLAALSGFDVIRVRLEKLQTRLALWLRDLDLVAACEASEAVREHEFFLRHAQKKSQKMMSPEMEALASDLAVSGSTAWGRLFGNLTSQIMVEVDGENLPMPAVRNLAYDSDRGKRQRAYEAELAAWKRNELPIAAALNGVKGEVVTLGKARGWDSPLDEALFGANIDRATFDAMMEAARESFPMFRRYLNAKARAIGAPKLAFYDLFAPVGEGTKTWGYEEACDFVAENFGAYSAKMGDFARRTFRENWIDAEPRKGKVGGAYCTPMRGDVSRVLMNYDPSYGAVSTLAHELGHAYHNVCLAGRSPLNQESPMTLAETASIFCETIIKDAALKKVGEQDQIAILEASLQGQCQVVVDITSRFLFEQGVFSMRGGRELSANEFSALMRDAQVETYGDGLDSSLLHPYMWAAKPHYYSSYSFYNFPYMFGLLFGLGLYAIYEAEPNGFHERYDDLLSSTGLADAPTLADRFGIDIRSKEFWAGSLAKIGEDVARFEKLV